MGLGPKMCDAYAPDVSALYNMLQALTAMQKTGAIRDVLSESAPASHPLPHHQKIPGSAVLQCEQPLIAVSPVAEFGFRRLS
jgi:hypothetical protein